MATRPKITGSWLVAVFLFLILQVVSNTEDIGWKVYIIGHCTPQYSQLYTHMGSNLLINTDDAWLNF